MSRPRRAGLLGLLVASAVSSTGTRVSVIAIPWLVLVSTGSPARTGLVAFAEMLPYVVVQFFSAPLLDRFGARRASVVCDAASTLLVLAVPVLYDTGHLEFWQLCVLVAAIGAFRGPGQNAKEVLIPEIVVEARIPMERGVGLMDGVSRVGTLVGAPLGGALAATIGAANALYADAASFGVAAVLVYAFVRQRAAASAEATADGMPRARTGVRAYLVDLREGLHFLWRDQLLRAIGLMVLVTNLLDQAFMAVLLPVWAKTGIGSATALGVYAGVFGLGAVVANAVFSAVAHRLPRRWTYAICFLVVGSPRFFVLAASDALWPAIVVAAVAGLACGAINPLLGAAEFERIPERLRARVLGAVGSLAWAGIPLGGLVAGWLVVGAGLSWALVALGATYLVMTLLPFVQPAWRLMDRRAAAVEDAEPVSASASPGTA